MNIQQGGKWLGAARSWLQWNTRNGESVTWGSQDVIDPPMTVKMIEDLAAKVAEAAIEEETEQQILLLKEVHKLLTQTSPDAWDRKMWLDKYQRLMGDNQ